MARFLYRAQDNNMTNGDFAFFTFQLLHPSFTGWVYDFYDVDPEERPYRRRAFYVVKQVRTRISYFIAYSRSILCIDNTGKIG